MTEPVAAVANDLRPDSSMVTIRVDGQPMAVPVAASVAAVLALNGVKALRRSEPSGRMRGVFCGMGSCYDCAVTIDGIIGVRSCLTPVAQGMEVETDRSAP